ncbi:DUF3617 family protein [Sphingomonas sp. CARO-RG-8B-R24-01]|uniref:DUF3617 domain-containing protein n=1 Tax=Sphingomonas sp. CARO-RG-8B-R24-01 TaxID=2914831 RepID=UPI001F5A3D27|nr:DUF3617 family protein [Sphingomonas sp. CARO-RG-8B-R24-01]
MRWTRRGTTLVCASGIALALGTGFAVAAPGAKPALTALARVERGQWQLKTVDDGVSRTLCLADPRTLIHYEHPMEQCQHAVVKNDIDTTTVHFICHNSHGQTSVKVATPRSFNMDTQGIINGAPFEETYEARYVGACAGDPKAH